MEDGSKKGRRIPNKGLSPLATKSVRYRFPYCRRLSMICFTISTTFFEFSICSLSNAVSVEVYPHLCGQKPQGKGKIINHRGKTRSITGYILCELNLFFRAIRTKFALRAKLSTQFWAQELKKEFFEGKITLMARETTGFRTPHMISQVKACMLFQNDYYMN